MPTKTWRTIWRKVNNKKKMLSTPHLEVMMDTVTSSCSCNELPSKIPTTPSGLIANTSHVFPRRGQEFFDSYGFTPNCYATRFTKFLASHPGETKRNVGTLQALNFNVCGYYCMFYLFHRGRPQDFKFNFNCFILDIRQTNYRHAVQLVNSVFNTNLCQRHFTRVACNVTCVEVKLNVVFCTVVNKTKTEINE